MPAMRKLRNSVIAPLRAARDCRKVASSGKRSSGALRRGPNDRLIAGRRQEPGRGAKEAGTRRWRHPLDRAVLDLCNQETTRRNVLRWIAGRDEPTRIEQGNSVERGYESSSRWRVPCLSESVGKELGRSPAVDRLDLEVGVGV